MNLELTGVLFSAGETVQVSDKLSKREFILEVTEVDGDYTRTQYFQMQLLNKNVDKLSQADAGKKVAIKANLEGKKFTRKTGEDGFILNITAWFVKFEEGSESAPSGSAQSSEEDDLGLPF